MMNDRQKMLKRVQMFDFILDELNLYLDTHPTDQNALDYFAQYQYLKNDAANQYEARFGPLRAEDFVGSDKFTWIKGPWPWESEVK
ncbi:MAG: spore coat protein CotJB [Oscillospiraceae bacterium]|nr:spore coat protein CotJB [Oscillospiraceae bacterium]